MQLIAALAAFGIIVYLTVSHLYTILFSVEDNNTASFNLSKEETRRNDEMIIGAIQTQWLVGKRSCLADYYPHLVPIARKRYLESVEACIKQERIKLQAQYERGEITQDELLDTILLDNSIREKLAAGLE